MHTDEDGVSRITERVIGGAFQVLNTLGVGFLERVYENALVHELRKRGLDVVQQHGVNVIYMGWSSGRIMSTCSSRGRSLSN
jgi:GxxExxY protein